MTLGVPQRMLALLLPLLVLAGCSTTPKLGGDPQLNVVQASALPAPERADLVSETTTFYIGPYDTLSVDVYGINELSAREIKVDPNGNISFPLAGTLSVSGKTPAEIEQMIAKRLRTSYIRDPQVTVTLKESISPVITIDGTVTKPGIYPVNGRMTLIQAMAVAGGTTEFSKLNDVVIFRRVGGQRLAALYNLKDIRHGAYADPEVYANDIVMVGDSKSRRMFKDILQVVPVLMTPLIIAADRLAN